MKQYINNRGWNPPIQQLGEEFTFGVKLITNITNVNLDYVNVPLFCPVMFNNLYSDVTENIASNPIDKVSGQSVGVGNYFRDIWGADEFNINGNLQSMFPYSQTHTFGYNIGNGIDGASITPIGYITIDSIRMQYVNLLEWLKYESLLCTNINLQINCKDPNAKWQNYPITFFQQELNGSCKSIQTSPIKFLNPSTNLNSYVSGGNLNVNLDIPCDFILNKCSGMSIGMSCDVNIGLGGLNQYVINYTLKRIIK